MDPAIVAFFQERKLSKEEWLPKAAKKAGSRALSTHPSKFSHPSTGIGKNNHKNYTYVSPVLCMAEKSIDGYLRSGNVDTGIDSLGDAAALDVDSFLMLTMADGNTLLKHVELETELAKRLLNIPTASYKELREGLLAIAKPAADISTSSKIKQVYFPAENDYHLLSILSNSTIIFELKNRIDSIRFSENNKEIREKKRSNTYSEGGYAELYNLSIISYGGAHPKNISSLCNQNAGKAYLLMSSPPSLKNRDVHFPKNNFFKESFRYYEYHEIFNALHKLFKTGYNNKRIREGRDYRLQDLMDRIIGRMWTVRSVYEEQYQLETSRLKPHQKIWLCEEYRQLREENDEWLDKLCKEITGWIIRTYERLFRKEAYKIGEAERQHINAIVRRNEEALK